jgi:predicted TIM-barrel fold metal-dependent hydrolase
MARIPAPFPEWPMAEPSVPPAGSVDCHAHVMRVDAALVAHRHSAPARDVDVAEYLDVLDRHGIQYGVLTAPSFYGTDNRILLEALASAQGRLRGTVIVDPDIPAAGLDALQAQGVAGIRLNWLQREPLPDSGTSAYRRLYGLLHERDMHVELYVEGALMPRVLPPILESGVRLVLDHFGSPDTALGLDGPGFRQVRQAIGQGNTWVKLSAPYRMAGADPKPYAQALLREGGAKRLLWATDWPWVKFENTVSYAQCLAWLDDWVPDAGQRHRILVETPQELFGFPAA